MGYQWLRRMPYLSKTRHGIYRYRRTIPPVLREAAGQREFVRSLETREPQEAKKLWAVVNLEFERYISDLETLANIPTNEAPVDVQQRIGAEFLKKHRLSSIPLAELREQHKFHEDHLGPSEFEKRSALVEELLGISMDDVLEREQAVSSSPEARAALGTMSPPSYKLSDAKRDYFAEKSIDLSHTSRSAARNSALLVERIIGGFIKVLGEDKSVSTINRDDAIKYRDQLLSEGKSPATAKKYVGMAGAVFQTAIVNKEINKTNPFRRLPVIDDTLERDKRLPLDASEIRLLLDQRERTNSELADILTLLVHTGARLGEISGLAVEDFDVGSGNGPAFINIRPNSIRRLKTRSSRRQVPLTDEALRTVQAALARLPKPSTADVPLFPRYGRNGGSDAASAALMKVLRRAGISDRRKAIHSIRHSMKDALRAVGCPEDIRDAMQGHAMQSVAASYGSGHTLDAKYEWLVRACSILLPMAEA